MGVPYVSIIIKKLHANYVKDLLYANMEKSNIDAHSVKDLKCVSI